MEVVQLCFYLCHTCGLTVFLHLVLSSPSRPESTTSVREGNTTTVVYSTSDVGDTVLAAN